MLLQKYTLDQYTRMLMGLLPMGAAFPRERATSLYNFMEGLAVELGRVDASLVDLINNAFPDSAETLLDNWEKDVGLPNCFDIPAIVADRRALVKRIATWPGAIPTGFQDTAATVIKGRAIVTLSAPPTNLLPGDSVSISDGIGTGYFRVNDILGNSLYIEQPARANASPVTVTGLICEPQVSARFYRYLALFLGYEITSIIKGSQFLCGPELSGLDTTGNTTAGSDTITGVASTALALPGQYLSIWPGFTVGEAKIISKTSNSITVDRAASVTETGAKIIGYKIHGQGGARPCGMGDIIGDAYMGAVTINYTSSVHASGDLFECVMNSLKPGHILYLYNFS